MALQIEELPKIAPTHMVEMHPDDTKLMSTTRAVMDESVPEFVSAALHEFGQSLDETGGRLTYIAQRVRHRQQDRPATVETNTLQVSSQDWDQIVALSERTGLSEAEVAPLALIHRVEILRRDGKNWAQRWGVYVNSATSLP